VASGTSSGGALEPGPSGTRLGGGVNPDQALLRNAGTCRPDAKGEAQAGEPRKGETPPRHSTPFRVVGRFEAAARRPRPAPGARAEARDRPRPGGAPSASVIRACAWRAISLNASPNV